MAKRYTDEFRRHAVRIATTSGLTRPELSSGLGVGLGRHHGRAECHWGAIL
jgi:transposase